MGAGVQAWESEEHQWVENMDTTKDDQGLKTPWFGEVTPQIGLDL